MGLIPYLQEPLKGEAIGEALLAIVTQTTMYKPSVDIQLKKVTDLVYDNHFCTFTKHIYNCWCKSLHAMANRTRSEFLNDLTEMTRFIVAFIGTEEAIEMVRESICAIKDIGRWWP